MSCSCEATSHGELGTVEDEERLARVITLPTRHLTASGGLKPGLFPPSHIAETGLSLMRVDKMEEAELTAQAEYIASTVKDGKVLGVAICEVDKLRSLSGNTGMRSLCVKDDPVIDEPKYPAGPLHEERRAKAKKYKDNPAHALVVEADMAVRTRDPSTRNVDLTEATRIQGELIKLFTRMSVNDVYR